MTAVYKTTKHSLTFVAYNKLQALSSLMLYLQENEKGLKKIS